MDEILASLNIETKNYPEATIARMIERPEIVTPHLLAILEDVIQHYETLDQDRVDYFLALSLLSKFRETQAFPLIIKFISLPDPWPDELLGDLITESLPRYIVSTYNGDLNALKSVIENRKLNEWARIAALRSLEGLFVTGQVPREIIIDYYRTLFQSHGDDEDLISSLTDSACNLYPEELLNEVNTALASGLVDPFLINARIVTEMLAQGKETCLNENIYQSDYCLPIDDIKADLGWLWWNTNSEETDEENEHLYPDCVDHHSIAVTYVRSESKIGRNAPCHCGSGKKFKKCCVN